LKAKKMVRPVDEEKQISKYRSSNNHRITLQLKMNHTEPVGYAEPLGELEGIVEIDGCDDTDGLCDGADEMLGTTVPYKGGQRANPIT
jgi:hypothetical protein